MQKLFFFAFLCFLVQLGLSTQCFSQSNLGICAIHHCDEKGIVGVDIDITGSNPATPPFGFFGPGTDSSGCVSYPVGLPISSNLTLTPTKDDQPLQGVTTYDLVKISRHILGIESLGSPYNIIAADANKSGSITDYDVAELRKLILEKYQELPNNTSWRFVDYNFVFPNASNPFQTLLPETVSVGNAQASVPYRFYGIKTGDVDCSVLKPVGSILNEEIITIPDQNLQPNDIVEVPVRFLHANDYFGFQFGLQFDSTQIQLLEVIPEVGTADNFGLFSDHLNVSWSYALPSLFLADQSVFHLRIKALTPVHLGNVFTLSTSDVLHPEAYPVTDSLVRLSLQFGTVATTEPDAAQKIFDPTPNPTIAGVLIPLQLEHSEIVVVEILDVTGQLLYRQEQTKGTGTQSIELPATTFPQAGVYMWRVKAGNQFRAGKIVKQ